jgi:DNA mismatch endonuclease, patch repair protein
MADVFTRKHRSVIMSRIKGANTKPEIVVRSIVHSLGYRFRLHNKQLPGKPDLVLPRHKKIIFVNGCFWHGHAGCPRAALPSSNVEFWNAKISGNRIRDLSVKRKLKRMGWKVLVIWQCRTRDLEKLRCELQQFLAK